MVAALACGTLFGVGLALSGMLDPTRIRGFLDVFGAWDPTLAFVLAGAVIISTVGFRLINLRGTPVLAPRFQMPTASRIDLPLMVGATMFGIGWALSGYCPGPAIASLGFVGRPVLVFVLAMLVGMLAFKGWSAWMARDARRHPATGKGLQ